MTRKLCLIGLLAVVAASAAAIDDQLLASPSSTASPPPATASPDPPRRPRGGLDPALRDALRQARFAAAGDGVELLVESGRRSPEHQQRLFQEAVARYGSATEAARWVATPDTSSHVSGDAVDIAPQAATAWLSEHGAEFGLCQIYDNEPWHFELRPEAGEQGCPPLYPDPTYDPRMRP